MMRDLSSAEYGRQKGEPGRRFTLDVRHFISSIEPGNAPSLRIVAKLGFTPLEGMVDGEVIFERRVA